MASRYDAEWGADRSSNVTSPVGQPVRRCLAPEKWSSLRYGSRELKEDVSDGDEEAHA
jgi:hypothetical protein